MNARTVDIQDILRLTHKETVQVLQWMDQRGQGKVAEDRRREPRHPYQDVSRVCVLLENEQRGRRTHALAPRNLSRLGISLLHGKFVYGGTNCVVGLKALDGQIVPVHGKVIWCRLVTGRVHELGVQFDDPIELAEFVGG